MNTKKNNKIDIEIHPNKPIKEISYFRVDNALFKDLENNASKGLAEDNLEFLREATAGGEHFTHGIFADSSDVRVKWKINNGKEELDDIFDMPDEDDIKEDPEIFNPDSVYSKILDIVKTADIELDSYLVVEITTYSHAFYQAIFETEKEFSQKYLRILCENLDGDDEVTELLYRNYIADDEDSIIGFMYKDRRYDFDFINSQGTTETYLYRIKSNGEETWETDKNEMLFE